MIKSRKTFEKLNKKIEIYKVNFKLRRQTTKKLKKKNKIKTKNKNIHNNYKFCIFIANFIHFLDHLIKIKLI